MTVNVSSALAAMPLGPLNASVTVLSPPESAGTSAPVMVRQLVPSPALEASNTTYLLVLPDGDSRLELLGAGLADRPAENVVLLRFNGTGPWIAADAVDGGPTALTVVAHNISASLVGSAVEAVIEANDGVSGAPVQVATVELAVSVRPQVTPVAWGAPALRIRGEGFGPALEDCVVTLFPDVVRANVTAATPTELDLELNFTADDPQLGPLTALVVNLRTGSSNFMREVQVAALVARAEVPASALRLAVGSVRTFQLHGSGFDSISAANEVSATLNGSSLALEIVSASPTALVLRANLTAGAWPGQELRARVRSHGAWSEGEPVVRTLVEPPVLVADESATVPWGDADGPAVLELSGHNFDASDPSQNVVVLTADGRGSPLEVQVFESTATRLRAVVVDLDETLVGTPLLATVTTAEATTAQVAVGRVVDHVCGNGLLEASLEQCDPGRGADAGGGSSPWCTDCLLADGWACEASGPPGPAGCELRTNGTEPPTARLPPSANGTDVAGFSRSATLAWDGASYSLLVGGSEMTAAGLELRALSSGELEALLGGLGVLPDPPAAVPGSTRFLGAAVSLRGTSAAPGVSNATAGVARLRVWTRLSSLRRVSCAADSLAVRDVAPGGGAWGRQALDACLQVRRYRFVAYVVTAGGSDFCVVDASVCGEPVAAGVTLALFGWENAPPAEESDVGRWPHVLVEWGSWPNVVLLLALAAVLAGIVQWCRRPYHIRKTQAAVAARVAFGDAPTNDYDSEADSDLGDLPMTSLRNAPSSSRADGSEGIDLRASLSIDREIVVVDHDEDDDRGRGALSARDAEDGRGGSDSEPSTARKVRPLPFSRGGRARAAAPPKIPGPARTNPRVPWRPPPPKGPPPASALSRVRNNYPES